MSEKRTASRKWGKEAKSVFRGVCKLYDLADHEVETLSRACDQLDHAIRAGREVERDGVTLIDRFGQTREHPALNTERACLNTYRLLMRELKLDGAGTTDDHARLYPR